MSYRLWIKRAVAAIAFANLIMQIISQAATVEAISALLCAIWLPEPFATFLKLAKSPEGRLLLSTGFALASCGLKLLLHPTREGREFGLAALLLLAASLYIASEEL